MIKPKAIYMDVGCWQSMENEKPVMTFGLIEHNAIALCSYYSSGFKLSGLPIKINKLKFDFEKSYINDFLGMMMGNKYGQEFKNIYQNLLLMKEYHIISIIPFPPKTLLNEESELILLIPDLHLHFFKDTYLDNFTTYFENVWSRGKPVAKQLKTRRSMEADFSIFLQTIIEYQQKKDLHTRVFFLGDTFEMWEINAIIESFIQREVEEKYKSFQELIEEINSIYKGNPKIKNFLGELCRLKIAALPYDKKFQDQISVLEKDKDLIRKLYIKKGYTENEISQIADNLSEEILKKHSNKNKICFKDLFSDIKWKYIRHGNHDNFIYISNTDPLFTSYGGDDIEIKFWRFEPNLVSEKSDIWYGHGHNFDPHNNDDACGSGYFITSIMTLFEAKKRADLLKKSEALFRKGGDIRSSYIKHILSVFSNWDDKDPASRKKNKIMIHAHTHQPYIKDITNEYLLWKSSSKALKARKPSRRTILK